MLQKTIPLRGDHRALLRLYGQDAQSCRVSLEPPLASGCLFLAGEVGQLQPVPLDPDGSAALCLDFIPLGALVYDGSAFPLSGGFAGRQALLEQARVAIRLRGLPQPAAAPGAPSQPPDPIPAPQAPSAAAAPAQPAPPDAPAGPAPELAAPCPAAEAPEPQPAQPPADVPDAPLSSAAQADAPPEQAASSADAPPEQAPQADPAPSRQQSPALLDILQRAQALFAPQEPQERQPAPSQTPAPKPISNPFPRAFPQSAWKRVEYPGRPGHYLVGEGMGRGGAYTVYALPGAYSPVSRQPGFGRFLRAADGSGYWIRIVPRRG